MYAFLHLSFKDSCSRGLIEFRDLQDVCRIDPVVGASAHDMVPCTAEFVDRDLARIVSNAVCADVSGTYIAVSSRIDPAHIRRHCVCDMRSECAEAQGSM